MIMWKCKISRGADTVSKDNDFFDSLFDLDGDGKTTPDEEFISFMIMDQVMKSSEHDYSPTLKKRREPLPKIEPKVPEVITEDYIKSREKSLVILCLLSIVVAAVLSIIPAVFAWAAFSVEDGTDVQLIIGVPAIGIIVAIWAAAFSGVSEKSERIDKLRDKMNRNREDMTENKAESLPVSEVVTSQEAEKADKTVYTVCGVKLKDNRIYNYLTGKVKVKVGDTVIVPVGYGEEVSATVVSVGKYLKSSAPYPAEKMKTVRKKGRAGF